MARATKQTTAKKTNATKRAAKKSPAQATSKSAQPKSSGTKIAASKAKAKSTQSPASRDSTTQKKSEPITISRDQVAARAYEIWVDKGQPAGQDEVNWQQAEKELGFAA